MLTEAERAVLVDDINSDRLDFEYDSWNPELGIYRFKEEFKKNLPYVMIEFLPANRSKFRSVGNAIGINKGKYVEYGYCQLENVSFKAYCNEFHNSKTVLGRLLAENTLQVIRKHVLKNWNYLLRDMGACIDGAENITIRDVTAYNRTTATKIIVYEMDLYLRTQFRWRKTPDDYEPAPIEKIGLYYKEDKDEDYEYELVESD
jgi:hypothetical protein